VSCWQNQQQQQQQQLSAAACSACALTHSLAHVSRGKSLHAASTRQQQSKSLSWPGDSTQQSQNSLYRRRTLGDCRPRRSPVCVRGVLLRVQQHQPIERSISTTARRRRRADKNQAAWRKRLLPLLLRRQHSLTASMSRPGRPSVRCQSGITRRACSLLRPLTDSRQCGFDASQRYTLHGRTVTVVNVLASITGASFGGNFPGELFVNMDTHWLTQCDDRPAGVVAALLCRPV